MTLPWRLKHWNGSAWVNSELRSWDGANWQLRNGYYWTGSAWSVITDRTPPYQNYITAFGTHDAGSYKGDNGRRTDSSGLAQCYQGYNTSTWGVQRSMFQTDVSMQGTVSGLVQSNSARIFFDNQHTYWNAGGTMGLGTHAVRSGAVQGTFSQSRYLVHALHFNKGEAKWVGVSADFAWWAADGSFCGPTIYWNSTDSEFYGYYAKFPTVELNYVK